MTTLNVSCIQRFSTGDGPGIRTTVFLKGCGLYCPWCHNPENQSFEPQTLEYRSSNKKITYGKIMTVDEVIADVIEDVEFYRESGGGVTLSGGEPLLQSKGAGEVAERLKDRGVTTLIDTAGCVPWDNFKDVIEFADMYYYDIKTADGALYKNVIGGNKTLIFDNLKKLIDLDKNVVVRVPLIPGFNMNGEDCEKICAELENTGAKHVGLLPFHRLGSSKYDALGLEYAYKNVPPPDKSEIGRIKSIYEKYFITDIE